MDFIERTLDEKCIYKGKILELDVRNVELPDGRTSKREIVKHPGGVCIIAFKDDETVLFVEQFRNPVQKNLLELPAGKLEPGEDPEECGIRELEEETGYKAERFTYLGTIVSSPGFCDERIHIYKAAGLYKGNENLKDDDEFINVKEMNLHEIKEMIVSGEITDAKTICAFMYL